MAKEIRYEKFSPKSLVIWEVLTFLGGAALLLLALFILLPGTWLWYTVLWLICAAYIFVAFLFFPLLYLNRGFAVSEEAIAYRTGVIFPKTELFYRDRIVFVTLYENPLTPLLHISSLVVSGAGGNLHLHFLDSKRAERLRLELQRGRVKK